VARVRSGVVVDALVLGGLAASVVAALRHPDGGAGPYVALVVASVATHVAGRLAGRRWRPALGLAALVAFGALLWSGPGTGALGDPLGYANANAQLYVQGALAAVAVALVVGGDGRWRAGAWAGTVVLAGAALSAGSLAGVLLLLVAVVLVALARWSAAGAPALRLAVPLALLALTAALSVAVATESGVGRWERWESVLSEPRVEGWMEAAEMVRADPEHGIGFGRWTAVSRTAARFEQGDHVHHDWLQLAAEAGVPVVVPLAAAVVLLIGRTALGGSVAALGSVALAIGALHALVDYTGRFPLLVLVAVWTAGTALGAQRASTRLAVDTIPA
jgi:O-antigen ligase